FISLGQSLMQVFILLSKLKQFFFWRHALTLQDVELFGKSLGHLSSYKFFSYFTCSNSDPCSPIT
ncbi:MAG TPA: hypothetical protein VFA09_26680, partial [Ktedonobacteraceae bacterium]|nr:hypothetical protein [Ktedonobacteraceae bacterium]